MQYEVKEYFWLQAENNKMFPLYYCTLASWPVTEKLTPQILESFFCLSFFFQSLDNSTLSEGGLKPITAIETFFPVPVFTAVSV